MQLEAQLHERKEGRSPLHRSSRMARQKGFDPLMGARPMARLIQDTIQLGTRRRLLFVLAGGGGVTIDIDDDGKALLLVFEGNGGSYGM